MCATINGSNVNDDICSRGRGVNVGLRLHLHQCFVCYAIINGSNVNAEICSRGRGVNVGLRLYLYLCFVCATICGSNVNNICSRGRGVNVSLRLHLHQCFVYATINGSNVNDDICSRALGPWICSQTRIFCWTCYGLCYAALCYRARGVNVGLRLHLIHALCLQRF